MNLPLTVGGSRNDSQSSTLLQLYKMRLGDAGDEGVDGGGGGGSVVTEGRRLSLGYGQWSVDPDTGVLSVTEATLARLINTDPIDKWYILDPEPIARGQFAVVYHCHHRITGEEFAAKFSSRWRLGADCTADIIHEVAVCAMLKPTQRTIQLHDVFSTDTQLVLVMEYAAGGDLQTLLDEDMVPYERDVISFTRQLLEGLVFLHDQNIVHLDIKPQNLVLMGEFPDCAVKLCDFEISRMLTPGRDVREILGTPDYVAPEILHYEPITKKTDMWSLGVLTYVLLTGFLPFGGDSDQETFLQISRGELDFPDELFEDVSPEAIDFMKKLLLRQPEKRMSARECLSHPWMKKEIKRPTTLNIPPAAVCTPASSTTTSLPPNTSVLPTTIAPDTPTPVTPTPSTEVVSPSQDIGLPPFHPNTPVKQSPAFFGSTSTLTSPVTPTSLQRQESRPYRPNLDRLRSMSKSREVLSERIQMSNLKKTISKSRERLFDAKLGLSKSRERLMGLRSLSQSVEVLSALSQLRLENAMYQSCNNIFLPMIAPSDKENDIPCRMYKSLAAIDQIDEMDCTHKLGYFESKFTKGSEDYNDRLTRHNTDMNSFIITQDASKAIEDIGSEARLRGGGRGGRGGDICDKKCPRHNHQKPEAQLTQKIPKVNRAERMKRDAQKRRKERKEKEEKEKQKGKIVSDPEVVSRINIKPQEKSSDGASSPTGRRGSVSHVEQRLAERHERQQERLERQEREERKGRISSRRRGSVDIDRASFGEKSKSGKHSSNLGVNHERPRSTTPTRRSKSKKDSDEGSDVSKASSLESVEGNLDSPRTQQRRKRPSSLELPEIKIFPEDSELDSQRGDVNDNIVKEEVRGDIDEAYVSLDEPSTFNRSRSIESNISNESDSTVTNMKEETRTQDIIEAIQNSNIIEASKPKNDNQQNSEVKKDSKDVVEESENSESTLDCDLSSAGELPVIQEEEDRLSVKATGPSYVRSISTSSDFGSMVSECSEGSIDHDVSIPCSPSTDSELNPDWKGRGRSSSIQTGSAPPTKYRGRSRSNSVHLEPTVNNRARPWGGLCNGAVARALEKFNIKDDDITTVGRSTPHRRLSSPAISPSTEDNTPPFLP